MKVLQINTICGSGSVGRITVDIVHALEAQGDEGMVAFGRRTGPEGVPTYKFGTNLDMGLHVLCTFFRGEHGFASEEADGQTDREDQRNTTRISFISTISTAFIWTWSSCSGISRQPESRWSGPSTTVGASRDTAPISITSAV